MHLEAGLSFVFSGLRRKCLNFDSFDFYDKA